jgi:hypothetical protein
MPFLVPAVASAASDVLILYLTSQRSNKEDEDDAFPIGKSLHSTTVLVVVFGCRDYCPRESHTTEYYLPPGTSRDIVPSPLLIVSLLFSTTITPTITLTL